MRLIFVLFGALPFGFFARAVDLSCTAPGSLTSSRLAIKAHALQKESERTLLYPTGRANGTLRIQVAGTPLKPLISVTSNSVTSGCEVVADGGDARPLFEALITDPNALNAMAAWRNWNASRPEACDPRLDAEMFFQPGAKKMALLFHGFASKAMRMGPLVQSFLENGYNVMVPRLSRHYTKNLKDLDKVKYKEWLDDADAAFDVAIQFNGRVALGGYSLGGILASELAVKHAEPTEENPGIVTRLVLFAPAWRINPHADLGSVLGRGTSLNEYEHRAIACNATDGYVSGTGSRQIERMLEELEFANKNGNGYPGPQPTIFNLINLQHLVFVTPNDEAIDDGMVADMCSTRKSVCSLIKVPGRKHVTILDDLNAPVSGFRTPTTINAVLNKYLK